MQAVIRVRDTGIGIDPSKLPEVFEPFYQIARPSPNKGGIGIGLALVKGLVRMHDGVVEVHSAGIGQGSEFAVRLPLAQRAPAHEEAEAPAPADGPSGKGRVLVVDDNLDSAESMAMLLEIEGFNVRTAHDGVQALVSVESFEPDVVLLDLGMPIMDGFETCRRLCERGSGRPRAIVALTGWGSQHDRQGTAKAGFDAHLVKPIEPRELVAVLERFIPVEREQASGSGRGNH